MCALSAPLATCLAKLGRAARRRARATARAGLVVLLTRSPSREPAARPPLTRQRDRPRTRAPPPRRPAAASARPSAARRALPARRRRRAAPARRATARCRRAPPRPRAGAAPRGTRGTCARSRPRRRSVARVSSSSAITSARFDCVPSVCTRWPSPLGSAATASASATSSRRAHPHLSRHGPSARLRRRGQLSRVVSSPLLRNSGPAAVHSSCARDARFAVRVCPRGVQLDSSRCPCAPGRCKSPQAPCAPRPAEARSTALSRTRRALQAAA